MRAPRVSFVPIHGLHQGPGCWGASPPGQAEGNPLLLLEVSMVPCGPALSSPEDVGLRLGSAYLSGSWKRGAKLLFDASTSVSMRHGVQVRGHTSANSDHMVTFFPNVECGSAKQ